MTDEKVDTRCQYICPRKQRQCKLTAALPTSTHCMEHLIYDSDLDEETRQSLRVPCPINPAHTISPHDLKRHLKRCNQRLQILGPFHRPNCNAGLECDNDDDYPTVLQDISNEEFLDFVRRMENLHDENVGTPLNSSENRTDFYLANTNLDALGYRSRKHLEQIGSLIGQLVRLNLLQGGTCFVEMGAGRGQLSHELHACLKDDTSVCLALIERDSQRYRYDAQHRDETQGPSFHRYRIDIRDLYLSELPPIRETQPTPKVVIVSKHLCGGATDLALRCASATGQVRAIVIALCCHHRLMWNEYVGKELFRRLNLTAKDFSLIRSLTSWGTNENRHRTAAEGKRSTTDGLAEQFVVPITLDKSNHSKQRLFSFEHQEQIGLKAKRLLDWGRIEYLKENGFDAYLQVYASKSITLENIALIATPRTS